MTLADVSPDLSRSTETRLYERPLGHEISHRNSDNAGVPYFSPDVISNDHFSIFDEYATNPRFQELQTELRSLLFTEARSACATRDQTPEPQGDSSKPFQRHALIAEHLLKNEGPILPAKKVHYLKIWIRECAPWLDMFDQARNFGLRVPVLAQTSPAVLYALLALSARQVERQGGKEMASRDSLELYSEAISFLTPSLNANQPDVLVTACILCVLEMMSVSPRDWRRHLQGCAALLEASGVNGFSGGLLQAVFWCYARMDLCAAIIADGAEGTVLPIKRWVLLDAILPTTQNDSEEQNVISRTFLELGQTSPDMHANYAVYLCAKVCNVVAQRVQFLELGVANGCTNEAFEQAWNGLWTELQQWLERRPPEMLPVKTVACSPENNQFPSALFAHWSAISGNQLYHTACILMLETKPDQADLSEMQTIQSPLWHARQVVGISLANPHQGCLNNAIQPLYIAGKLFSHYEEHKLVCDILHRIEAKSGWGSRWRIKDLEIAWGYPRGTFGQHQR
ncbi:hypothetical protein H2198_008035 [Neophaeococcomyces mojaviensis]|uniref:Uncharacterized protein n=1 Tax=Neophaeococcomyces mojaviensis TaxID=3383035 RepID=A0ACC2ZYE0_9EURO|nr:hypothetical protein H2198_008035 [Knufia sp. JES_112]